uniref:Zinc-ribbon domain-containing protein n=1 Tax=Oryzias latipes TaxID=8090 RepID=A0A3P9MQ40_ORYLA
QLLCICCNSALPENAHMCLVCEEPVHVSRALQVRACTCLWQVLCVSCGSGNPPDISRCLTCEGVLLSTPSAQVTITCSRCNSENRSDARFCNSCGSKVSWAPPTCHLHLSKDLKTAAKVSQKSTPSSDPTPSLKVTPPTVDKHTQTIGLYYPSFTELQRKEPQRQQGPRDPQPPLTAVSPGRGFWRKQLDHVCGHLRSYAQNNAPFRALLGEPRFGRVRGSFILDSQLLKELGPGGGRVGSVQRLLDQGADPSCCGSDGRHALAVAVMNRHPDVLPVLLQRGADPDQQSGSMKNTALHEAAALGSAGLQCAAVLLRWKASVRQRNAVGETPYDVAASSGGGDMASLLAAQTGPDLLGWSRLSADVFQPLGRGQGFAV